MLKVDMAWQGSCRDRGCRLKFGEQLKAWGLLNLPCATGATLPAADAAFTQPGTLTNC